MAKNRVNNGPLDATATTLTDASGNPAPEQETHMARFAALCLNNHLPWGLRSKELKATLADIHEANLDTVRQAFLDLHKTRLADLQRFGFDPSVILAQAKTVTNIMDGTSEIVGMIESAREAKVKARKAGTTTTGKTAKLSQEDNDVINRALAGL